MSKPTRTEDTKALARRLVSEWKGRKFAKLYEELDRALGHADPDSGFPAASLSYEQAAFVFELLRVQLDAAPPAAASALEPPLRDDTIPQKAAAILRRIEEASSALSPDVSRLVEELDAINRYAYDGAPTCGRCQRDMHIELGDERTKLCHDCAHWVVDQVPTLVAALARGGGDVARRVPHRIWPRSCRLVRSRRCVQGKGPDDMTISEERLLLIEQAGALAFPQAEELKELVRGYRQAQEADRLLALLRRGGAAIRSRIDAFREAHPTPAASQETEVSRQVAGIQSTHAGASSEAVDAPAAAGGGELGAADSVLRLAEELKLDGANYRPDLALAALTAIRLLRQKAESAEEDAPGVVEILAALNDEEFRMVEDEMLRRGLIDRTARRRRQPGENGEKEAPPAETKPWLCAVCGPVTPTSYGTCWKCGALVVPRATGAKDPQ